MATDRNNLGSGLAAAAALCILAGPAMAQTPWLLDRGPATAGWMQVQHPLFKSSSPGITSWLVDFGGRVRLSADAYLLADLPLSITSTSGPASGGDGVLVGNPFLGVGFTSPAGLRAEVGVRAPLVGSNAPINSALTGALVNIERLEAYVPETWSITADLSLEKHIDPSVRVELGGGPMVAFPKGGGTKPMYMNYRAGLGYDVSPVRVMAFFSGRWYTNSSGNFGQATVHQLSFAGTYLASRVRPTLYVRVPLDQDLSDFLSLIIGAGVSVGF
jgi:hypothetical protein